jgi:hypothetical protein
VVERAGLATAFGGVPPTAEKTGVVWDTWFTYYRVK